VVPVLCIPVKILAIAYYVKVENIFPLISNSFS
jgi:hypothetical protein